MKILALDSIQHTPYLCWGNL